MGQIEWAMWANEQAVISGAFLLLGAIIGVSGDFMNWQFAACAVFECVIILLLEYPRSKRVKGNTIERKCQLPFTKFLDKLRPVSSNYYFRFVLHIIFSIPCCFLLPTIMGGLGLMLAAVIYLAAAIKGEEWKPVGVDSPVDKPGPSTSKDAVPIRAPPRRPQQVADHIADTAETGFNRV